MTTYDIGPLSLEKIRTYPLAGRRSKVSVREFGWPLPLSGSEGRRHGATGEAL